MGAGAAGAFAGLGVYAVIGIATAGTGAVVCAAVGSIAAGYVGAKASDSVMDTIYEYMGILEMKSVLMVLLMLPLVCLVVSVLLYLINRSRYQELISDFQKKHTLPTPYLLHCNMGYIGSPLMTYFFMRLKQNKKILFLNRSDNAYSFAHESQNLKKINTLKPLYYTFAFGFLCCLLTGLIVIFIQLHII